MARREGLLHAPPPPWCPPGEQGEEAQFSCGRVLFWEGKPGWEAGSERSVGPHGAGGGRVCFWSTGSRSAAPGS